MKVTAAEIADLLSSSPPRKVAAHIEKAANRERSVGALAFFALVLGGMGLLFTWLFFPWGFQKEWQLKSADVQTTAGVITAVKRSGMSINKTRVMVYTFNYTPPDGRSRLGNCFTTGTKFSQDARVRVRYLPADPDVACVEGARVTEAGWGGMFILLFPVLGGGLFGAFALGRKQTGRLLREGLVAEVDVVSVKTTSIRVNKQPVYRIELSSPNLPGGQSVTVMRSNLAEVNLASGHAQRKQPVFILYDPMKPRRMLFPEALIDP